MHGLIEKFQALRQVEGGDAFLEQFMAFVAQRVHKTPEEYWQHCLDTSALLKRIQAQADALEEFTWPFDEPTELYKYYLWSSSPDLFTRVTVNYRLLMVVHSIGSGIVRKVFH